MCDSSNLLKIQELYVRLLFSDVQRDRWLADRAAVLSDFAVPERIARSLPDVDSSAFQNERYGRKVLIAREIQARYTNTLTLVLGTAPSTELLIRDQLFSSFLASEHFLTPKFSLPHPYGIGRGYESISKFFLWLRQPGITLSKTAPSDLRSTLYLDFATHLVSQAAHTEIFPLALAKHGVIYKESPNDSRFWILITPEFRVVRMEVDNVPSLMSSRCLFLDLLTDTGVYERPQGFLNNDEELL